MKTASVLIVPCVCLLVIGASMNQHRATERQSGKTALSYSQPFEPQLKLERGKVPGYSVPGLFEVESRCISQGGSGQSKWLVRAVLTTNDQKSPREVWNSQAKSATDSVHLLSKGAGTRGSSSSATDSGVSMPLNTTNVTWRFVRSRNFYGQPKNEAANLKMTVEAVAIPIAVPEDKFGDIGISVNEATPAQIAAAKQQSGAKYFRESIELKAQDDSKYYFSRDAMK